MVVEEVSDVHRFNEVYYLTENTVGMILGCTHHGHAQHSTLPFVLIVHFRNGNIKIVLHPSNNALDNLPLLFEGAGFP